MNKEALKLVLEALKVAEHFVEEYAASKYYYAHVVAIAAAEEALAQAQRTWIGLTDEKVSLIAHNIDLGDWNDLNFKKCWHEGFKAGFREAEIEHNIKE